MKLIVDLILRLDCWLLLAPLLLPLTATSRTVTVRT